MEFNEQFVSESELLIHSKLIIQAIVQSYLILYFRLLIINFQRWIYLHFKLFVHAAYQ